MMLICGKPFIICEGGATTIKQCIECEQPELAISPALYAQISAFADLCTWIARK